MSKLNINEILKRFYDPDSACFEILENHNRLVCEKAVKIADKVPHLTPDIEFIKEASMLHDIGICRTNAPNIGCNGEFPYVFHGVKGREMLNSVGLYRHGLVAERHTGTGITVQDITERNLGLPVRDMVPVTIEEIIICYADKFFSKNSKPDHQEKTFDEVVTLLNPFGKKQVDKFIEWAGLFGEKP